MRLLQKEGGRGGYWERGSMGCERRKLASRVWNISLRPFATQLLRLTLRV